MNKKMLNKANPSTPGIKRETEQLSRVLTLIHGIVSG
jgi:hypothetical protein